MVDNIDPLAALLLYEWILMQFNQGFRIWVGFEMAVQTEEKKLKVKKGKISNGLKEEATIKPVSLDFVGEKSKDAPLTKLEVSQMKEALMAFKKLVELHDSEEVKKKDLLGSACGEGRKVQVSVAAIKLPRVADAQVHKINMKYLHYFI